MAEPIRKRFVRLTPIDDLSAFGSRLRAARRAAGLSLRELSFPGCSPAYISRLENGHRLPSLQVVHALAAHLGIEPDQLTQGSTRRSFEELLTEAEVALRLDDLDLAEETFRTVSEDASGESRARALGGLGQLLAKRGDVEEAIELLEEARGILGERFARFPSLVQTLGLLRAMRSEFEEAIALFEAARQVASDDGDRQGALRFTLLIANSYIDLGALHDSADQLASALREAEALDDLDLRARTLWSQSRLHTIEGRHDLAARFAERALAALELAEDDLAVARARQLLAYIELERGNPEAALQWIDEALPLIDRVGDADERAVFRLEQARALLALGSPEKAREVALDIAPDLVKTTRGDAGRCFITFGDIWTALDETDKAHAMYDAAIEVLSDHRNPHLVRAYKQKAALLETSGDRDGALDLLKRAIDVEADTLSRR